MYLWNIRALKDQLSTGGITENESLKYLLILTAIGILPIPKPSVFSSPSLHHLFGIIILIFGTLYCYQKNRGAVGTTFLSRYFSLSLVIWIRILPIVILAGLTLSTGLLLKLSDVSQKVIIFTFIHFLQIYVYWRVGYHIADVAEASNNEKQGGA